MIEKSAQFKDRFRQAINKSGLSQAEISRRSNIRKQKISDYLKGKYEPKHDRMRCLAKILNVDESWLMGFSESAQELSEEQWKNLDDKRLNDLVQNIRTFNGRKISDLQRLAIKASKKGILKEWR